jgi:CheY-like chemotaxis protein
MNGGKLKILFLDDEPYRHKEFAQKAVGNVVIHVYTADEAIDVLESFPKDFDLIMLDHDLCDVDKGKTEKFVQATGLKVARYIAANKKRFLPATIIVHSLNPPGAANMIAELLAVGLTCYHIPFAWKKFNGQTFVI